jgi:DNA-binding beta-propeller fold protein YncE
MCRSAVAALAGILAAGCLAFNAAPAGANYHLDGGLLNPGLGVQNTSIAVDQHTGTIYGIDAAHNQVDVISSQHGWQGEWGSGLNTPCSFRRPAGIAVDPSSGNVVFADAYEGFAWECTPSGGVVHRFDTHLSPGGVGVIPASHGHSWALLTAAGDYDTEVSVVFKDGHHLEWGDSGGGRGEIAEPPGELAVDPVRRLVYVPDFFDGYDNPSSTVEQFTETGKFLRGFQILDRHHRPAIVEGLGVTSNGDILVAADDACIQKFTPTATLVAKFACDQKSPEDVAADASGTVYAAEPDEDQVLRYKVTFAHTTITSGPVAEHWSDPTPTFKFTSSEAGSTFNCEIDSATQFTPCPSPFTSKHLTDGRHRLAVRATDEDGFTGYTSRTSFLIDTQAPKLKISGATVKSSQHGTVAISLTCPSSEASGPCNGDLFLHTSDPRKVDGRTLDPLLGIQSFTIGAGHTRHATVALSAPDLAVLRGLGAVKASVFVNVHDRLANRAIGLTKSFTLKAP